MSVASIPASDGMQMSCPLGVGISETDSHLCNGHNGTAETMRRIMKEINK
jgi:hypothetical protein